MKYQIRLWGVSTLWMSVATVSGCASMLNPIGRDVEKVSSYLIGVMDTTEQAQVIQEAPSVRMITCKIIVPNASEVTQRSPAIFLYQEQALTTNLAEPYRQRFLQISPSADGQLVESATFKPADPPAWSGLCDRPESERLVTVQEMGDYSCSVFLTPVRSQSQYVGKTQSEGCPSNYRGAVKVTNHITLDAQGMETLDRGFDQNGNQIWGAEERPYQYRRIQVPD